MAFNKVQVSSLKLIMDNSDQKLDKVYIYELIKGQIKTSVPRNEYYSLQNEFDDFRFNLVENLHANYGMPLEVLTDPIVAYLFFDV